MRATFFPVSKGDAGVNQKIGAIRGWIEKGKRSAVTRGFLAQVLRGIPERSPVREIGAIVEGVRARVRYTRDPAGVEMFTDPDLLLSGQAGLGDCDDFVIATGTALEGAGYKVAPVVGWRGGAARHVWLKVLVPGRGWTDLDPANRDSSIGWTPEQRYDKTLTYGLSEASEMETIRTIAQPGGVVSRMEPYDPYLSNRAEYYEFLPSDYLRGRPSAAGVRPKAGREMTTSPTLPVPPLRAKYALPTQRPALDKGFMARFAREFDKRGLPRPLVLTRANNGARDSIQRPAAVWKNGQPAYRGKTFDFVEKRGRVAGYRITTKRGPKTIEDLYGGEDDTLEGIFDVIGSIGSTVGQAAGSVIQAIPQDTWRGLMQVGTDALQARLSGGRRRAVLTPSTTVQTSSGAGLRWEDVKGKVEEWFGKRKPTMGAGLGIVALLGMVLLGGKKR
jgi:transglutaminase superfamily protein